MAPLAGAPEDLAKSTLPQTLPLRMDVRIQLERLLKCRFLPPRISLLLYLQKKPSSLLSSYGRFEGGRPTSSRLQRGAWRLATGAAHRRQNDEDQIGVGEELDSSIT
jgi:hypothetical protein